MVSADLERFRARGEDAGYATMKALSGAAQAVFGRLWVAVLIVCAVVGGLILGFCRKE